MWHTVSEDVCGCFLLTSFVAYYMDKNKGVSQGSLILLNILILVK